MAGALDPNGIWLYGEDDQRDTFSALLNIGQDSVSDAVGADRARLAALEAAGVLTGVSSAVMVAASGWTIDTQRGRKKGGVAFVEVFATRTGAPIVAGGSGNITNVVVATWASGWAPAGGMGFPAGSTSAGIILAGYASSSSLFLGSVSPSITIATGEQISLATAYPLG